MDDVAPAALPPPSLIAFHRLIEDGRPPERADRSALGTLPTRAYRHCEAVAAASGFGWYLFPPTALSLLWDGASGRILWTCPELGDAWLALDDAAQFPGFAARFDAAAPAEARGFSPPFLTALREPGTVQLWSGLVARTAPGWSLLVRPPANLPRNPGLEAYEGLVETDRWFGPLFTNLRLTRTDSPVHLDCDDPFAQVQPIPQAAYADGVLGPASPPTVALDALAPRDWADYVATVVAPSTDPDPRLGRYAAIARKRRRGGAGVCPFAAAS
jgi:hypothetical protein